MKFKVGDRVRVKEGLRGGEYYGGLYFSPYMEKYCGKTFTVSSAPYDPDGIERYKLDGIDAWCFSGVTLEPAPFGKANLQTGMQVRTKRCGLYMVLENINTEIYGRQQFILAGFDGGYLCGEEYDDDLKNNNNSKCDIEEVYAAPNTSKILKSVNHATPIWKREEKTIEITIAEIAELKGVSPERIRIKED